MAQRLDVDLVRALDLERTTFPAARASSNNEAIRIRAIAKRYGSGEASQNRPKAGTRKRAAKLKRKLFAEEFVKNGGNAKRVAIAGGARINASPKFRVTSYLCKPWLQRLHL